MSDAEADRSLPTGFASHFHGYAWLDSIDRIGEWTESNADPIQISNTPLMKRPDVLPSQASGRSNIMLMHDAHHDGYDGAQAAASSIDQYTLEHWQSVEVFVYFGHRRAMVPPVSWINAGHRNGVLVLGTFCCEGDYDDNGHILHKRPDGTGTFVLADALARIAKWYGFDGWLINIETKKGPYLTNLLADNGTGVAALIGQLKSKLPSGKVIWYDGTVNTSNPYLRYQNTLNGANTAFAQPAESIMTNYWWDENPKEYFDTATKAAAQSKMSLGAVYFGLECQGQRIPNFVRTYRGGTATGEGVELLAANGFGSGLFSIAWAFEDFNPDKKPPIPQQSPRVVDRFMWEGQSSLIPIIQGLKCSCDGGSKTHLGDDNGLAFSQSPIVKYAKQYPAGSEGFFRTDYSDAMLQLAPGKYQAQIAQQSIFPATRSSPMTSLGGTITTQLSSSSLSPKCTIRVAVAAGASTSSQLNESFTLHYLNAKCDYDLQLSINYRRLAALSGLNINIFTVIGSSTTPTPAHQKLLSTDTTKQNVISFALAGSTGDRITAIGIALQGPANIFTSGHAADILDIFQITVKPAKATYPQNQQLTSVKLTRNTASTTYPGETPQRTAVYYKLTWSIPSTSMPAPANWPSYLPWSAITGPFSYFTVGVGNTVLGRAHALAYVIDDTTFQGLTKGLNGTVSFVINGYAFDGSLIGSGTSSVTAA